MNPDALNRRPGKWLQKYEISLIKTKRECQNNFHYPFFVLRYSCGDIPINLLNIREK